MPTDFSSCVECYWHNTLPLNHLNNKNIKDDYEKLEILRIFLPIELAVKILRMSYTYFNCCYCNHLVCKEYTAIDYEQYGLTDTEPVVLCSPCMKYYIGYI